MRFAMWAYPWDVLDVGLDTAVADLRDRAGVNGINLATSYHAGRFFQPRSPVRKTYFPEDGTIYFRPNPALWADRAIAPKMAELVAERGDILAELARRRDETGLAVACWTVCLHNTRLGLLHPGACTRNAFGDPNYYSLCPSHPDVRAYAVTLVQDLSRQYRPETIQLESPGFMGYRHGFHHELDGVGLAPEDDFLLSLCFCDACLRRAAAAGTDGEAARRTVRAWIQESAESAVPQPRWPDFAQRGSDVFRDHAAVEAYVLWRFEPVTSLVAEIRVAADAGTRIEVIDGKDGWRSGSDLSALSKICDGVVFCAYDRSPAAVGADAEAVHRMLPPKCALGIGMRLFHPEMQSANDIVARSIAAAKAGATMLHYYNYGLVPAARLDWVRAAVDAMQTRLSVGAPGRI
ncbi:MAG TPA: hypothetical protein VGQ35_09070 [Dongiaceae bacterium]|nr:hypothetical protein [Dongiaceae bacterium]